MNTHYRSVWMLICLLGTVHSDVTISQLDSPRSLCGEGPHWDESSQSLYYVDIYGPNETLLRYDFNENKTYTAIVDGVPLMTFILPVEGTTDEFLVGTQHSAQIIRWDGKSAKGDLVRTVFEVEKEIPTNRFNDAKSDPRGRFIGGTMTTAECHASSNTPNGSLFEYERGSSPKPILEDVAISNGMTWLKTARPSEYTFYYVDSCSHDLLSFDYDMDSGEIFNDRVAFSLNSNGKVPDFIFDGMTNDRDGNLYIATFGGGKVMKIDPIAGTVLAEYDIPSVKQITSVAFGGPKLDILFVTTASKGDQRLKPEAGHLYQISGLNAVGLPAVKVIV